MNTSSQVILTCCYSMLLLIVAWLLDVLGRHGSRMSREWKTTNFVYHNDRDGWKCHEDHWLWPASFDPQKRVVRYRGQHEICGRCPVKDTCSPTVPAREVTMPIDPWPYSEAGLFHRGMTVCAMVAALALPVGMFFVARSVAEVVALVATIAIVCLALVPTAASMRHRPVDIPEGLPLETSVSDTGMAQEDGRVRVFGVHGQATTDRAGDGPIASLRDTGPAGDPDAPGIARSSRQLWPRLKHGACLTRTGITAASTSAGAGHE